MTESDSSFPMDERVSLAERVESASQIETVGKETAISVPGDSDTFDVSSYKATVVRSLLRHDLGDVNWVVTEPSADGHTFQRYDDELPPAGETVVGVSVTLPVGTLSIKGTSRANDHHSSIVSTPSEVEQAREAFTDD